MFGIGLAVAVGVENLCQCNFTPVDVVVSFQCPNSSGSCMNVSLLYNNKVNDQSTTGFMRSWIESMQTVTVLGDRLTVASDCLTTGSTSVNITAIIFSSIFGTLVLIILIVAAIAVIVCCFKRKRRQDPVQQDFDKSIYEIIADINTHQNAVSVCCMVALYNHARSFL